MNCIYLFPFMVSQAVLLFMREYLTTRLSSFCMFDLDTTRAPAWIIETPPTFSRPSFQPPLLTTRLLDLCISHPNPKGHPSLQSNLQHPMSSSLDQAPP